VDCWRGNNFALIRVLASAQVAVMHAIYWFGLEQQLLPLRRILHVFPGVPVFFFISGLLVTRSLLSTTRSDYFRNRSLRIFPALWVCLVLTLLPVVLNADCSSPSTTGQWLSWWFAQMSFGQMWTPGFLQGCWQNSFNGGRWTVAVELEFYALLPLLLLLLARFARLGNALLILLAAASLAAQAWIIARLGANSPPWLLILHTTLVPYLWIFILGMLAQRHFDRIAPWFQGRLAWWLLAYAAATLLTRSLGWKTGGSDINPLSMLLLCALVLSLALSLRGLADRLLRGHDLTYGLYLLHPVVFLLMTSFGLGTGIMNAALALLLSAGAATLSWFLVERSFLRRKRHSAQPEVAP
jgi:peptidoglycan/LPS O-acetylase OafA/YrhL